MRQKQHLTMLDKQTRCRNFRKHWTIARETMMYECSYIKCEKLQQCLMIRINDSMMTRHLSFHWKRKSIPKINRQLLAWLDIRQQLPTKWIWNEFFKTISVIVGKNNFNDILKWWCFCDHQKNSNAFITDNFDLLYF